MHFKTLTIRGVRVTVTINDDGRFTAESSKGHMEYAATFEELEAKIKKRLRGQKVRVAIEATQIMPDDTIRNIILTGLDGRTEQVRYTYRERGKDRSEVFGRYGHGKDLLKRLTVHEASQLHLALKEEHDARQKVQKLQKRHALTGDVHGFMKKALDKLARAEGDNE